MQAYNSRKKHLKTEKERKLWEDIDFRYMSDENSDEDKINKRTLPWRSQGINHLCFCPTLFTLAALNKLIGKLDKRMDTKSRATNCYIRRKERLQKSPSKLPPPKEAPSWAISSNYQVSLVSAQE